MSYHIYNTRAIVLSSRGIRERDKTFTLLTDEFGLIRATARGIRGPTSRLGSILLDYAIVNLSLVKGKNTWRVTTASLIHDSTTLLRAEPDVLKSLARILNLLEKLINGEEANPALYADVESAINFEFQTDKPTNLKEGWEIITVLRILFHLGYLSKSDLRPALIESPLTDELVSKALEEKQRLIALANSGIRESGL